MKNLIIAGFLAVLVISNAAGQKFDLSKDLKDGKLVPVRSKLVSRFRRKQTRSIRSWDCLAERCNLHRRYD